MNAPRTYLPAGLPAPVVERDGLSEPFWNGLRSGKLLIQRCSNCRTWRFGPEWICHRCHSFEAAWEPVEPRGRIFSWERVWHPSHGSLSAAAPYLVVLVELPEADGVRLIGNLLGDPLQNVTIGDAVHGVFERHDDTEPHYALLQWRV